MNALPNSGSWPSHHPDPRCHAISFSCRSAFIDPRRAEYILTLLADPPLAADLPHLIRQDTKHPRVFLFSNTAQPAIDAIFSAGLCAAFVKAFSLQVPRD